LLAWTEETAFIPGLALGVWRGSSKLFEVMCLMLWSVGLMNGTPRLDYLGATDAAIARGMAWVRLLLTILLLGVALLGRRRHLRAR
jgi:hypothetical protein